MLQIMQHLLSVTANGHLANRQVTRHNFAFLGPLHYVALNCKGGGLDKKSGLNYQNTDT